MFIPHNSHDYILHVKNSITKEGFIENFEFIYDNIIELKMKSINIIDGNDKIE